MPFPRINLPPLTRALLLILISLSSLNAALRFHKWSLQLESHRPGVQDVEDYLTSAMFAIPYLVLIPTESLKFPWTFLTAALVENNLVSLTVCALVIWFGGRYLERAWGSREFTKFLLFVIMIPNCFAFCVYAIWHAVTGSSATVPIQGLIAVEAGFLVALKQLVPEHTVSLFKGVISVRIKHFPAIFVLANMISGPVLGTDTAFWLSLTGFYTSWIYLRFFRISEITTSSATGGEAATMKGDASDTFAFVAFFPDAVHPFLAPVCDGLYNALVQLRVCAPFSQEAVEVGNESAASRSEGGLPNIMNGRGGGGRRAEAERRRALALKALDQRLNAAATNRMASAPISSTGPNIAEDVPEAAGGALVEPGSPVKEAVA